jgi:hypothetical protein
MRRDMIEHMDKGWTESLDRLEEYVAEACVAS